MNISKVPVRPKNTPTAGSRSITDSQAIANSNYTMELPIFISKVFVHPDGRDFNIADLINLNLKQFPEVQFVKIYDQNGQTQSPNGRSDSEPLCLSEVYTPPPTSTPTPTQTLRPTATPLYQLINVYFASRVRYDSNAPPIEHAGVRWAHSNVLYETALNEFFKGPGSTERYSYGWIGVYNGFTGYISLDVSNGVARVYLTGACISEGKDFNIADLIDLNLKQFPEIQFVKIYDQNGQTQNPNGASDSEPLCLSEVFTPLPTATRTLNSHTDSDAHTYSYKHTSTNFHATVGIGQRVFCKQVPL